MPDLKDFWTDIYVSVATESILCQQSAGSDIL